MQKIVEILEYFLLVLGVGLAIYWIRSPTSTVEPYIALVMVILVAFDVVRRRHAAVVSRAEVFPVPEADNEVHPPNKLPVSGDRYLPKSQGSRALFSLRFAHAFPGIRDITWFSSSVALDRLCILLEEPLTYGPEGGAPIWWWRSGNLHISEFKRVDNRNAIMNWDELKIRRIAAVPNSDYRRCWVYVECDAMNSAGVSEPLDAEAIRYRVDLFGYAWEEYAVFMGHNISRAEYDDGAAIIGGKAVKLNGAAHVRARYLTPYNFLIAPIGSPVNNNSFDSTLKKCMNDLLQEKQSLEDLAKTIELLPVPDRIN